jgi:hypothetical protein
MAKTRITVSVILCQFLHHYNTNQEIGNEAKNHLKLNEELSFEHCSVLKSFMGRKSVPNAQIVYVSKLYYKINGIILRKHNIM